MTNIIILLNRNSPLYSKYKGVVFEYNTQTEIVGQEKHLLKSVSTPIKIYMQNDSSVSLIVNPNEINMFSAEDLNNTPFIINELVENISALYDVATTLNDKVALLEAHILANNTEVTRH